MTDAPQTGNIPEHDQKMKITAEGIIFFSRLDLVSFIREYEMSGLVKLSEPIVDNSGNVLFKENLFLKESILNRLEEMEGQFKPIFKVIITEDILKRLRVSLSKRFLKILEDPGNDFLRELYEETRHRYKDYIRSAFYGNRSLVLTFFKISKENRPFFYHAGTLGLLSLGIMIQRAYRVRFINRNAFLSGLLADLPLSGGTIWKNYPEGEQEKKALARKGAELARRFKMPEEICEAIQNHPFLESQPSLIPAELPAGLDDLNDEEFDELIGGESEGEEAGEMNYPTMDPAQSGPAATLITECLKIARYVVFSTAKIERKEHFAEELVYNVAYNAARGYFHKELINPLIKRFRAYEETARKVMRVAEIEQHCLFPPSAWAYPKPRASQILCKNHIMDCPKIVMGWDIHVVSTQDALGWIGAPLKAGEYSKCSLEDELEPW